STHGDRTWPRLGMVLPVARRAGADAPLVASEDEVSALRILERTVDADRGASIVYDDCDRFALRAVDCQDADRVVVGAGVRRNDERRERKVVLSADAARVVASAGQSL